MTADRYGREISYLRISLTDHCNLRCVYCMPLTGLTFAPAADLLDAGEIETVVRAAVGVGFRKFRLTGGEPMLREDLVDIVGRIARVPGVDDLALTTNGVLLPGRAAALADAGLRRVNIHVDTFHPERLRRIMRFGDVGLVWAGIAAAEAAGLVPIKLNAVVTRGFNDEDVTDLARLTLERDWHVRFIELMPLGRDDCARTARDQLVPTSETMARIERELGHLEQIGSADPSDESVNYRLPGARGVLGFISPVSRPYCGTCNRMRLTADGRFHLCLLHDDELDVRAALRSGGGIPAVREVLLRAVAAKPTGHDLAHGVSTLDRAMFQLGG